MKKCIYLVIIFSTFFCTKGFSQAYPPIINTYSDSSGPDNCDLNISFTPNDTGNIQLNLVIQQGTGNSVYDSTYTFTASDSAGIRFQITVLNPCTQYQVLTIMSNDRATGVQSNPLLTFSTLCASGITSLNENPYSLIAYPHSVEVRSNEIPETRTVEIYDLAGRLILITPLLQSVQQIPFNQNAGIYLLRITGNGLSLYTNRFVNY